MPVRIELLLRADVCLSKLPKNFRTLKVIFLSLSYKLPVVFKIFLSSKLSKIEFLGINFVHVKCFSDAKSFREFDKREFVIQVTTVLRDRILMFCERGIVTTTDHFHSCLIAKPGEYYRYFCRSGFTKKRTN